MALDIFLLMIYYIVKINKEKGELFKLTLFLCSKPAPIHQANNKPPPHTY